MAYKVQIQYDEPIPECCSDCRFNYDWLYCVLDNDKNITTYDVDGKPEGRPNHCKLISADVREVHSHWGDRYITFSNGETEYICLNCLKTNGKANPPICPNCGAIMDEGDE